MEQTSWRSLGWLLLALAGLLFFAGVLMSPDVLFIVGGGGLILTLALVAGRAHR